MSSLSKGPSPAGSGERERWGHRRKLLLQLLILPCVFLAAEGTARILLAREGEAYDGWKAHAAIVHARDVLKDESPIVREPVEGEGRRLRNRLHPYTGFETVGPSDTVEAEYFRTAEAAETFDILVLGGSVAAGFAWMGEEGLAAALSADPRFSGVPVRILNRGRSGFKQPQQTGLFSFLLSRGVRPDCVVNIDGFNEVALGNFNAQNGAHPTYPSVAHWGFLASRPRFDEETMSHLFELREAQLECGRIADRALDLGFHHSALLGRFTLWRLAGVRKRGHAAFLEYVAQFTSSKDSRTVLGPPFEGDLQAAMEACTQGWAESSRTIHGACATRGITYVHVLQPTLHDEGSKPLTEDELLSAGALDAWIEGVHAGYPMLRAAGRDLVEEGIVFVDASRAFSAVEETLYHDACHFKQAGHSILAGVIAGAVLSNLPDSVGDRALRVEIDRDPVERESDR